MEILYTHEHQINIEQFEDFQSFKNFIEETMRNSSPINYISIDSKCLKETCLDIASKNGLTSFVKTLLRQGVQINKVNKKFNRAPIHFATEGEHVDTLEALLDDSTVNPNLQAGQQTALHIAVNKNNLECASLLLKRGANAIIPNKENLTAISLAATNKQCDMMKLILQEHRLFLDLDNYRDYNNQTMRKMIEQNLPELSLEFYQRHAYDNLEYYLRVKDETNFCNTLDQTSSLSMYTILLELAMQNNLRKAVIAILRFKEIKNPSEFVDAAEMCSYMTIEKGNYAILQELLNIMPEEHNANGLIKYACEQLQKLSNQGIDGRLHISDWLKCMKLLLDQKGVNIHKIIDDKFNTPLHYAVKSNYNEVITLILSQDSYIGHLNKFNIPPIADIPERILSNYFDNCIQMKTNENTNKCAIEFNYRCLMPPNVSQRYNDNLGTHELGVFMYIADSDNLKQLLKHPLLSSFLYLKWYNIRCILYGNFAFYIAYYVLLNSYIISMAYNNSSANANESSSANANESKTHMFSDKFSNFSYTSISTEMFDFKICQNNILQNWIILMLVCYFVREVFLLVCCFCHYIKDWTNWLQIIIILLSIALMVNAKHHHDIDNNHIYKISKIYIHIGIMVILLSTLKLMMLIGQDPTFSIGILIFFKVIWNFVRLFSPYILLIMAFAVVFQILFKDSDNPNFKDPNFFFSIVKTIIMLTGEFDIDDITFNSKDQFESMWIRFVFVTFVFFMVIVLMNMISAMAISDTTKVLNKTELTGLIYRIRLIAYFENIACAISESIRQWEPKRSSRCSPWWRFFASCVNFVSFEMIFLFPCFLRDGKSSFEDNPTSKMDYNIIKQAKQIIFHRNQLSDNDKIMIALNKLQKAMGIANNDEVLDRL
ncbi:transient receptor potential cation channel protein painless [Monomorium pharaonis]|uniref:transient receptor potential cation channel protein painless n=1 Tax=Monomorium pharaonis TaxID=307658 RepID=UPI001746F1FE|nr:transient receptor potential cation channel protein painless [Monomorium pharaonis]